MSVQKKIDNYRARAYGELHFEFSDPGRVGQVCPQVRPTVLRSAANWEREQTEGCVSPDHLQHRRGVNHQANGWTNNRSAKKGSNKYQASSSGQQGVTPPYPSRPNGAWTQALAATSSEGTPTEAPLTESSRSQTIPSSSSTAS